MGKGDRRTRRGKIFRGTYGLSRTKKENDKKAKKQPADSTNAPKSQQAQ